MPKESLSLNSFHNGLNSKTDARDIKNDELALCHNISVDDVGKITMSGNKLEIATSGLTLSTLSDGYNLFRFSSDYAADGTTQTETDYLILWDDTLGKLYWLPGGSTWSTVATVLDLSSDWGTTQTAQPIFYYVDGALRISDGNFLNTDNPSMWIGTVNRNLFTSTNDAGQNTVKAVVGWNKEKQELLAPASGTILSTSTAAPSGGIHWRVRNLVDYTDGVTTFTATTTYPGRNDHYIVGEELSTAHGNATGNISDETWQVSDRGTDGYSDSYYHSFGICFHGEDDDNSDTFHWTTASAFNTGGSANTFTTGQSLYLAVRMPNEEAKQMWMGTHTKAFSGEASLAFTVSDGYIIFSESSGNDFIKFHIDPLTFTDTTTPSAEWHILEFPYDEAYETDISGTFAPQILKMELSVTWTRSGTIYTNGTGSNSPLPYSTYKHIPGFDLIQISDLRVGDTDLVGVTTYGKQKFVMSYTYDDTESESLLYDFGSTESNELGRVVLANTTSAYKIGIDARVSEVVNNTRVTGANLYMDDDGVPFRIAELRYMKGLKGAWESEYPTKNKFTRASGSPFNHTTSTIKTDGLPLLESFEAMNGFKPSVETITANYKTATVLNRRAYVANIYQNSKKHGDRMIKSNANSFDVIPSEGKGIDVVVNDGDSIVKLESYADRILQFKKNVMYLINATRQNEFLEDVFVGKGITSQSASTPTDIGIAWANENGAYLYDGKSVHNLSDGKIKESEWQTHITASTDVTYHPLRKKIFVTGGSGGQDVYEYTFFTKSWTKSTSKLDSTKTNFVIDKDNEIKYVASDKTLYKWDDSSSSSDSLKILTRDFYFSNPAVRKKCFKFYVSYKCSGYSSVRVYYGTNGINLTGTSKGTEVDIASVFAGTSTNCYNLTGLLSTDGEWKQAELLPPSAINNIYSIQLHFESDGTTPADFEINDITIIYREKPLK